MEQPEMVHRYRVLKSILFENCKSMALAENHAAAQPYVTWQFTEENGKRNFYWGHYFSERQTALTDYAKRATTYQNDYGVEIVTGEAPPRLIRFIDSRYNTLFHIPDGGHIAITLSDGEQLVWPCQFLDLCHIRVGANIFHNCEFAEKMEAAGNRYETCSAKEAERDEMIQKPRETGGRER